MQTQIVTKTPKKVLLSSLKNITTKKEKLLHTNNKEKIPPCVKKQYCSFRAA